MASFKSVGSFLLVALCCVALSSAWSLETVTKSATGTLDNSGTDVSVSIQNDIINPMVWVTLEVTSVPNFGDDTPLVSLALDYTAKKSGQGLFFMIFNPVEDNSQTSLSSFSLSTCAKQFSYTQWGVVDVGQKIGNWNSTVYALPSERNVTLNYKVTIGAQSGLINETSTYDFVIPTFITYLDFSMSSFSQDNNYDVTFELSTDSPSGLSWLTGLATSYVECPDFSFDEEPLDFPDVTYIQPKATGKSAQITFKNLPAKNSHLAIQVARAGVGANLSLSWTSKKASSDNGSGGMSGSAIAFLVLWLLTTVVAGVFLASTVVLGYFQYKGRNLYDAISS